jgi:HD-like signal output (HDOD) protein
MSTSNAVVNSETLELLKRAAAVPSVPHVVTRFLELTQEATFEYDDLAGLLGTDPGIASEILRLANSALFGVARKVTSLRQALTLLGLKRIRSLVLSRYMVQSVGSGHKGGIDMSYLWRRSLASAVLAARFADILLPGKREEAFISALLADIGVVILADGLHQRYLPVSEHYRPCQPYDQTDLEQATVGATHADVSAMVLEHWQLPDLITKAVRYHHHETWPLDVTLDEEVTLCARITNGSSRLGKLLCERPHPGQVAMVCSHAMDLIGLEPSVLVGMLDKIESDIQELAEILRVDVIPSGVYELIAGEVKDLISNH